MKITNWRRKLAATLVAGGMISPAAAARAANLNTNLVTNGNFETVDINTFGEYAGPLVLGWTGPNFYAYSHDGSTSAGSGQINPNTGDPFPAVVPDYADGAVDPPGAGHWYFTPNNPGQIGSPTDPTFTDVHDPGVYYQDIVVSAGPTGTAINDGKGRVDLSAYMSSYDNDTDFGNVRVEFRDAGGASIGFTQISDTADAGVNNEWNQTTGSSAVPAGTASFRVSLFGTRTAGGPGADGYTDNVDVRIIETVNPQFLVLEVNTSNGNATIKNSTGAAVHINYYEITSAQNSLKTTWTGLQGQNLAGFPPGNGTGNGWEKGGGVSTAVLSENYLTNSSNVVNAASVPLGSVYTTSSPADLIFSYAAVPPQVLSADFEDDGDVDGVNFLTWQKNFGTTTGATKALGSADGDADVDGADYALWKAQYGDSTFSGPGVLVRGVVKYVPAAVAIPEPSSVILAGLGLAVIALRGFKDENRR